MANFNLDRTNVLTKAQIIKNKEDFNSFLRSTEREGIEDLIKYLETTDFYTAPASTKFHSDFKGGLISHKISDLSALYTINDAFKMEIPAETMIIATLLHDICKANLYTTYERNVKQDNGTNYPDWYKCTGYKYDDENNICLGHGEASVIIAQRFIKLTEEEMSMIRWHMGAYEEGANVGQMSRCSYRYKGVVALQMADMISSYHLEHVVDHFEIDNTKALLKKGWDKTNKMNAF